MYARHRDNVQAALAAKRYGSGRQPVAGTRGWCDYRYARQIFDRPPGAGVQDHLPAVEEWASCRRSLWTNSTTGGSPLAS